MLVALLIVVAEGVFSQEIGSMLPLLAAFTGLLVGAWLCLTTSTTLMCIPMVLIPTARERTNVDERSNSHPFALPVIDCNGQQDKVFDSLQRP